MRVDGGGRTPPTVIASPLACLKIDVIFVILSTLLPCRPRVSRASAPGHLFLHAYKLTSTLLHTATPSSRFSRRVPRIRDARNSVWKKKKKTDGPSFFSVISASRVARAIFFGHSLLLSSTSIRYRTVSAATVSRWRRGEEKIRIYYMILVNLSILHLKYN